MSAGHEQSVHIKCPCNNPSALSLPLRPQGIASTNPGISHEQNTQTKLQMSTTAVTTIRKATQLHAGCKLWWPHDAS